MSELGEWRKKAYRRGFLVIVDEREQHRGVSLQSRSVRPSKSNQWILPNRQVRMLPHVADIILCPMEISSPTLTAEGAGRVPEPEVPAIRESGSSCHDSIEVCCGGIVLGVLDARPKPDIHSPDAVEFDRVVDQNRDYEDRKEERRKR